MQRALPRRLTVLCALASFLGAALCSVVLWRAYGYALVIPDTTSYLYQAREFTNPVLPFWQSSRTPGFGYVLQFGLLFPNPGFVVFLIHTLLFAGTIALACVAVSLLSKKPFLGLAAAVALLCIEVWTMQTLLFSIVLLTDSLYANLLFAGTVMMALGVARRSVPWALAACVLLGLTNFIRPMGTAIVLFAPLLCVWHLRGVFATRTTLACLMLLVLPLFLWMGRMAQSFGSYRGNPFIGLHLTSHASYLIQPGDVIFKDPALNAGFHQALTGTLPESARGAFDPFGNVKGSVWWAMLSYYGSLTETFRLHGGTLTDEQLHEYGFQMTTIAKNVGFRAITLHPRAYIATVLDLYGKLFNPSSTKRYAPTVFQTDPAARFLPFFPRNWSVEEAHRLFYGTETFPDFTNIHFGFNRLLSRFVISEETLARIGALRYWPAALYHLLLAAALGVLWSRRKKPSDGLSGLALLSVLLILVAGTQYALTAAVSTVIQARFSLPGNMGLHLALILAVLSTSLFVVQRIRQTPSRVSTQPPASGS
jgi:hypothetical protein